MQAGDPAWLQHQLEFHLRAYEEDQDYRVMSLGAALIISSPMLFAVAPELLVSLQASISTTGAYLTEYSVVGHCTSQILANSIKNQVIRTILKTLPLSFGLTRKLINAGKSPLYVNQEKVFAALHFIITKLAPPGVPPKQMIWPTKK